MWKCPQIMHVSLKLASIFSIFFLIMYCRKSLKMLYWQILVNGVNECESGLKKFTTAATVTATATDILYSAQFWHSQNRSMICWQRFLSGLLAMHINSTKRAQKMQQYTKWETGLCLLLSTVTYKMQWNPKWFKVITKSAVIYELK